MPGMNFSRTLGVAPLVLATLLIISVVSVPGAWAASKFKTLYTFAGGSDGNLPSCSLIFDASGNLYGTTQRGGAYGNFGTVFRLTPSGDGSWTKIVLHSFNDDGKDGYTPSAGLIFDQKGNLYGTTTRGGAFGDFGTVFRLTPNGDGDWTENVLHSFDGKDGWVPSATLVFDTAGHLFGTTWTGGFSNYGTVFQLTPNQDGGWTESVIHSFSFSDGGNPIGSLVFDPSGNLYGTTESGGDYADGTVFKLRANGDGSWKESVLHSFKFASRGGSEPFGGLIIDGAGNLYGTASRDGRYEGDSGTVFQLKPNQDGSWEERVLHSFNSDCKNGCLPYAGLIFDTSGNLYGATVYGGVDGWGTVFKLRRTAKGSWEETVLHSFRDHPGALPFAGVIFDEHGKLYGTSEGDEGKTFGSVFQVAP